MSRHLDEEYLKKKKAAQLSTIDWFCGQPLLLLLVLLLVVVLLVLLARRPGDGAPLTHTTHNYHKFLSASSHCQGGGGGGGGRGGRKEGGRRGEADTADPARTFPQRNIMVPEQLNAYSLYWDMV